jgi:hypothetical protein
LSYVGGPERPEQTEPRHEVVVVANDRTRSPMSASPLALFAGVLLLALLTFGSSVVLLTRVASVEPSEEEAVRTSTPIPTRAATPAATAVRVTAGAATAERLDTGTYRITFNWTLDGAREGDAALLRFSIGSRVISEQRGNLDATVFTASTGRLTVATSQDCSAEGWSAELVTLRGVTPIGEPTSRANGVTCR